MNSLLCKSIFTTLLFLFFTSFVTAQFSYQPKRTNLTILYNPESGWILSDITGTKVYASIQSENAHIRIVDNKLVVYVMSEGLWNKHPESRFLDRLDIPHKTIQIETNSARFDAFSSFWVSASGGHVRISKYSESQTSNLKTGNTEVRVNQNIGNHLFLNRNSKAKISSKNTIFMISPKGNIFEVDHSKNIWRFILTNRTLTPWTSDPPQEKMVFRIFNQEDFKAVIPVGKKGNNFLFQVINHSNKMGLATLSMDYFQIDYLIPPLFDFISPSLAHDYHYVYNDNKLGILSFEPQEDKNKIPEFTTIYLPKTTELISKGANQNPLPVLADDKKFDITKNGKTYSSYHYVSTNMYGIEVINNDLILYNEYSKNGGLHNSGLFKISQNTWYIKPKANFLKQYETGILETSFLTEKNPISYAIYSNNGRALSQKIVDFNSQKFFYLNSILAGVQIDSMAQLPVLGDSYFKYKSEDKWGLIQLSNENWETLSLPKYSKVNAFGYKKSVVLTENNSFDWYGIDYSDLRNKDMQWIKNQNPLTLYSNNAINPIHTEESPTFTAYFYKDLFIYSSPDKASLYKAGNELPELTATQIAPLNFFIYVIQSKMSRQLNSLYTPGLKLVKTTPFDSVYVNKESLFLLSKKNKIEISPLDDDPKPLFKVTGAYHQGKPVKSIKKYDAVYLQENYLLGTKESSWSIIDPCGIRLFDINFSNALDASKMIQSLK